MGQGTTGFSECLSCMSEFEVPDLWPKDLGTCSPVEWDPGSWNQEMSFQVQAAKLLLKNMSNSALEPR